MESFSCCSSYMKCSDVMKCLHIDEDEYKGCSYRSTLESGICFYGSNANKDTFRKNCFDSCKENSICIEPDKECSFRTYLKPCFHSCTKDSICIEPERDCSFRSTLERGKRELELKPSRDLKLYLTCFRQYFKICFFENNMTYPLTKTQHEALTKFFSESHIPYNTKIDSFEELEGIYVKVIGHLNACVVFRYGTENFVIHGNYEEALKTALAGNFRFNGWYAEGIKKAFISKGIDAFVDYLGEGRGTLAPDTDDDDWMKVAPSKSTEIGVLLNQTLDPIEIETEFLELIEENKSEEISLNQSVPERVHNTQKKDKEQPIQFNSSQLEIIKLFNKGYSKDDLIKHIFYINKSNDKSFTRLDAKKITEETLLLNQIQMKNAI